MGAGEDARSSASVANRDGASARAPSRDWSIPRGLIVLLSVAGTVVTVAGMKEISGILAPVFLALILTIAVQPIQDWFGRRGWPAWVGMLVALIAVNAILIGLVAALIVSTAQLASLLTDYSEQVDELLQGARDALSAAGVSSEQIHNVLSNVDLGKVAAAAESALQGVLGVFSNLVFVLALLLFMTLDGMSIGTRLTALARQRPEIAYALSSFAHGTRKYLIVSTVFGLIVAVIDGAALWLMGIPLPILWALLSFITNYIPNIGFVLGLIPPAVLGLLEGGPALMIAVIAVYSIINVLIQSVIQPKFVGDAIGLTVTVTFLSLIFWSWVLGPLGAILAIPLSLLVKAFLLDIDPTTRWVDTLIGTAASATRRPEASDGDNAESDPPRSCTAERRSSGR